MVDEERMQWIKNMHLTCEQLGCGATVECEMAFEESLDEDAEVLKLSNRVARFLNVVDGWVAARPPSPGRPPGSP